jgi:hypothetical protein
MAASMMSGWLRKGKQINAKWDTIALSIPIFLAVLG